MAVRKIRAGRVGSVTVNQFVGEQGTIFYEDTTGEMRISDGATAGGIAIGTGGGGLGLTGATGPRGFTGNVGATGLQGNIGLTGATGPGSNIAIYDEGNLLVTSVRSINFVGATVTANVSSSNVTVTVVGNNNPLTSDRLTSGNAQVILNSSGPEPYVLFPAATNTSQLQISEAELSSVVGNLALTSAEDGYVITNGSGAAPGGAKNWKFDRGGNLTLPGGIVSFNSDSTVIGGQGISGLGINVLLGDDETVATHRFDRTGSFWTNDIFIKANNESTSNYLGGLGVGGGPVGVTLFAAPGKSIWVVPNDTTNFKFEVSGNLVLPNNTKIAVSAPTGYRQTFTQDLYGNTNTGAVAGLTVIDLGSNAQLLALIDPTSGFGNSQYNLYHPITITYSDLTTQTFTTARCTSLFGGVIQFGYDASTAGHSFPITLQTSDYSLGGTSIDVDNNAWKFSTDGNLTLPQTAMDVSPAPTSWPGITFSDGTFQNTAWSGWGNLQIDNTNNQLSFGPGESYSFLNMRNDGTETRLANDGGNVQISAMSQAIGTAYYWNFVTDGNLTLPQTVMNASPAPISWPGIRFSDGTFQSSALPASTGDGDLYTTYLSAESGWESAKASDNPGQAELRPWANLASYSAETVVQTFWSNQVAGTPVPGQGTPISMSYYTALRVSANVGAATYNSFVRSRSGNVRITANTKSWTFGHDGRLSVQGNVLIPTPTNLQFLNINAGPLRIGSLSSVGNIAFSDGTFQTTAYTGGGGAASTVDITNTNGLSNTFYPTFVEFRTTGQYVRADVDFTYRSDSNTLTVPKIAGILQGNVDHAGGYINFTGSPAPGTSGITFADGTTQTTAWTKSAAQVQSTPPSSPVTGQMYYDTDDGRTYIYTGAAWIDSNPAGAASPAVDESFGSLTAATGVVAHDCTTNRLFYHTSMSANFTANFTNLTLNTGRATSITLVLVQGATARMVTAVQIGGVSQTITWQGSASAPAGNASRTDVVTFSILNVSGTYTVLGMMSSFGGV